ncbi:MAG: Stk1 family PASTA domain-containing Ser/Thr kinase [Oscillospiraceae bacterium]|nr:Stk1 family PASTA domain-containing Ser/Thr kinase [Oscillospiraceae bacterium]
MDKNIGVILGDRYEVKKRIGVGGMADVYRAYDSVQGRDVAVKILKNEYTKNDEFLQRFKNESKAVSMLSHPNIVKVIDVGFNEEVRYIVMEYIDGITLKEYMESQQKLEWKEASHFIIQILRALGLAHNKGIIHRDIKPQNIMMFEDGTIKVMDFGIAKFTYELGITATAQTIGSVHYISPEQACGKQTDGSSDIYSVGILLYEMLTGKKPFDTENPLSVALMQMNDIPEMPRSINPEISAGQEEIILRAIEKDPADRYHTAQEMIRDIEMLKNYPDMTFGYRFSGLPEKNDEPEEIQPEEPEQYFEPEPEPEEPDPRDYDPDEATPNYYIDRRKHDAELRRKEAVASLRDAETEVVGNGLGMKLATIGTVIGLIVVVAVIAGFVMKLVNGSPKEETTFAMPSLVQYDYDDMVKKYSGKLVITVEGDPVFSEYVANTIVRQSIDEGQKVEKGTEVFVNISSGKRISVVPDVSGCTSGEASDRITDAGFGVVFKTLFNDKIPYDKVIRISPEAGTEMESGKSVTVYVSKGNQDDSKILPNVTGKKKDEAVKILSEAGYKSVEFEEKDDKAPEGEVISQNFPGDTLVNPKEKIILIVSTGKEPTEVVPLHLTFPEGAYGVCTFRIYIDNELAEAVEDINIDGVTDFTIDVTGSEKKTVRAEIMNIFNGGTADIGTYKFDFKEKKYETVKENMKEALEKIGSVRIEETTPATPSPTPTPSPAPTHAPTSAPVHTPTQQPEPTAPEPTEAPAVPTEPEQNETPPADSNAEEPGISE